MPLFCCRSFHFARPEERILGRQQPGRAATSPPERPSRPHVSEDLVSCHHFPGTAHTRESARLSAGPTSLHASLISRTRRKACSMAAEAKMSCHAAARLRASATASESIFCTRQAF